jgi:hypothetical protein
VGDRFDDDDVAVVVDITGDRAAATVRQRGLELNRTRRVTPESARSRAARSA